LYRRRRCQHCCHKRRPQEYFRIAIGTEKWVSDLSALPSNLSRYRADGPWRGFPQFPQALCQSRGPARAGCCQDLAVPAISASDMPMAGGLAWQAWDGELREHGSWRPGILSHRIEVRKSTSGAAACSVTERWRRGRLSRRASMMPILSRWGSADIRHNIAQERQERLGHIPCNGVILVGTRPSQG
jgi:hypothetical protein